MHAGTDIPGQMDSGPFGPIGPESWAHLGLGSGPLDPVGSGTRPIEAQWAWAGLFEPMPRQISGHSQLKYPR
jgi:hypothetical protein